MGRAQVAELPIKELLARVEAIEAGVATTFVQAGAVQAHVERPKLKVSKALHFGTRHGHQYSTNASWQEIGSADQILGP